MWWSVEASLKSLWAAQPALLLLHVRARVSHRLELRC